MAHMTDHQARQLSRALDRAEAEHITVAGVGTVKATNEPFWVVNGSTGNQYFVRVIKGQLVCSCPAAEHGIICKHRGAVYLFQRTTREARARLAAERRERALPHRSSGPISIFR